MNNLPGMRADASADARANTRMISMAGRRRALQLLARHVIAGALCGLFVVVGDMASTWLPSVRGVAAAPRFWTATLAFIQLCGMALLPAVLAGGVLGLIHLWLRQRRSWRFLRRHFGSPRRLFAREPRAFALTLGSLLMLLVACGVQVRLFVFFATRFHRPELAGIAATAATLGVVVGAVVLGSALVHFLFLVGRGLGRMASVGVAFSLFLILTIAVALLLLGTTWVPKDSVTAVGRLAASRTALVCIAIPVGWLIAGWTVSRLRKVPWPAVAGGVVLASGVSLTLVANFYSQQSKVRTLLEQQTVLGRALHRFYANASDWDRDGHSWSFGGGDCDDWNGQIFPGAIDVRGDGVDADCLLGDGTPLVEDFGDGAYGRVPAVLQRPNLLLVSIDALRPDHLGVFGYDRPTSPNIDAFAKQAVRFRQAISPSSRSVRSIPGMMTGFYPSQLAYGPEFLYPSFLEENRTVAEELRDGGYRTHAIMGTHYFEPVRGFFQGFEHHQEQDTWRARPASTVDLTLAQLEALQSDERPWLLWTHLMNVHAPYLEGGPRSQFGSGDIAAYDTEIQIADRQFGRLLAKLEALGVADDTVVVLVSDHGEAFEEHGFRYHANNVHEEEISSVLMIRGPGVAPRLVEEPVSLIDLTPTLLNLADLPVPEPMPGRSLVPLMTGEGSHPPDRLLFSEVLPDGHFPQDNKMIRQGADKLIWWVREGRHQLFDLAADPKEKADLSDERFERALELRGLVQAWTSQTSRSSNQSQRVVEENRLLRFPDEMTHRLNASYRGIFRVVGFDLKESDVTPNDLIELTLYYEVLESTSRSFRFEVEFESDVKLPPHFHGFHYPLNGHYLSVQWKPNDKLRDAVSIVVPRNIPAPSTLRMVLKVRDGLELMKEERSQREAISLGTIRVGVPVAPSGGAAGEAPQPDQ